MICACLSLLGLTMNAQNLSNNSNNTKNNKVMKFELPVLPYATDALEPVISKQTIEFHYGKHLQTYINNLNNLLPGSKFENSDLETIVKESDGAFFNNAGQILNHNIYFLSFSPKGGGEPKGKLAEAIKAEWGSFENFKKEFNTQGTAVFGSGWVWLSKDASGKLYITKEANAGNPVTKGYTPLLGFDVWEHAYYLDYQNRRADHLTELWKIIDWDVVSARY
ncbi:MAG: superoxide dismutase [Dysgonomonas sp.]